MATVAINPKYKSKSMSELTYDEKYMETFWAKSKVSVDLFEEDVKLAEGLNISRIIRFKFHEWLQSKLE
jgi:hypothetical protein